MEPSLPTPNIMRRLSKTAQPLADTLTRYVRLYNRQIPQKALGHIAPVQALKNWQHKDPKRFKKQVYNLTGLDTFPDVRVDIFL